jgi:hypothetical protein
MKLSGRCGIFFVQTKETKAVLGKGLDSIRSSMLDILQAYCAELCDSVTVNFRDATADISGRPTDLFEFAGALFTTYGAWDTQLPGSHAEVMLCLPGDAESFHICYMRGCLGGQRASVGTSRLQARYCRD